jgi:RNA polymerase sigma factor (TIGR02999 family)
VAENAGENCHRPPKKQFSSWRVSHRPTKESVSLFVNARRSSLQPSSPQITQLLKSWSEGDQRAIEELIPLVYAELHSLAQRYMSGERLGHTLQATALVNEAWLRLADSAPPNWDGRTHFFAVCAQVMRRILVDWARSRHALKRGNEIPLQLDEAHAMVPQSDADLVAIDDALTALAAVDARKSQVVELRFFGGLSVKETAGILNVSLETVQRDWKFAKSWLRREIASDGQSRGI